MSSSTTEVFNKNGVETTMKKIGGTFQDISRDYVNADQQMISNLTTPDGAMFGEGATKVLNAWDENSGTLEDFMTTFENWAALVSGMATQYADLETGTYKVKDGSPYSEDDIANRARDFHTTALKTEAGIIAFNTAQSDYYEKNKDKDYLQSYDNNGIAYTSVRRLENGKIVETKVYKDEQGNYIAEEEHWAWNNKDKKFEHTTEYYSGGSIDASGQYNHKGSNSITEEDFKKEYNKIKAASEAQTGSGQTGGGGEDTSPYGNAGPDRTDQVIINTEEMSATTTDNYTLFKNGDKTYIKDPNGDVYLVTNDDGTYTYKAVDPHTLQPTEQQSSSNQQLDRVINGLTENSDYAKGLMGGNAKFTVDDNGNLVENNPFNIPGAENITMTTNYGDNNQPISYTIKDQDGNEFTLTPKEYEAIMTQKGTATLIENGKTVKFKVDTENKKIIKTTSDNNGVVSEETASIGDNGKVTVSYKYRDAGTEKLAEVTEEQYKKLTDGGQEGHIYNYENGVFSDTYRDDKEHATITIEEVPNDDKTYKKTQKYGEEETTYTVDNTIVTEQQYKNVQKGRVTEGSSDRTNGTLKITTYKIENGKYTETIDDTITITTRKEDSSGRKIYQKTTNKTTQDSDEYSISYDDEGNVNCSVNGTITRNGEKYEYSFKNSNGTCSEIKFGGVNVSQGELANLKNGKEESDKGIIEYSIKEGKYTAETYDSNHKLKRKYITDRNENGDLEREITVVYKDDNSPETHTTKTYENGKVKKIEIYDYEKRTRTIRTYENGKVIETVYGEDGKEKARAIIDGDENTVKEGEGK